MKINCFSHRMFNTSTPFSPIKLPSQMETHLWYALPNEVKSQSLLNQYVDLLSPLEKDHIFSISALHLQKSALLARALVRTTISRYQIGSQVNPRSLEFRKNPHGKPEIGIDVEDKQRTMKNNILSFAKRYFTFEEVELLSAISDPEVQRHEFIKLWTLKEAYVKALGRGFSGAPFSTFTIRFRSVNPDSEDSEIVIVPLEKPSELTTNWQFAQVELAGSHYAAICRESNGGGAPMKVVVRKTIPLVEEHIVSEID
uniref:holo-[acyl-carrier-protein] synthase n=1 Tax=Lactuca sativa TaxID=4236 RepID=A0A9R1WVE1_LACSA|nr:hypothetical protein LSAT_V11C900463500 [Lactuca sativa]